jgi:hypothetical protein
MHENNMGLGTGGCLISHDSLGKRSLKEESLYEVQNLELAKFNSDQDLLNLNLGSFIIIKLYYTKIT